MTTLGSFPGLLEAFFTDRLMRQRQASPHTIASYRDTFRLFLEFASPRLASRRFRQRSRSTTWTPP